MIKSKIGEREAEAFVELLDKKVDKKFEDGHLLLATKENLANTKTDIIRWVFAFFATLALMIIGLFLKS